MLAEDCFHQRRLLAPRGSRVRSSFPWLQVDGQFIVDGVNYVVLNGPLTSSQGSLELPPKPKRPSTGQGRRPSRVVPLCLAYNIVQFVEGRADGVAGVLVVAHKGSAGRRSVWIGVVRPLEGSSDTGLCSSRW